MNLLATIIICTVALLIVTLTKKPVLVLFHIIYPTDGINNFQCKKLADAAVEALTLLVMLLLLVSPFHFHFNVVPLFIAFFIGACNTDKTNSDPTRYSKNN